jgi:hypothetical protein
LRFDGGRDQMFGTTRRRLLAGLVVAGGAGLVASPLRAMLVAGGLVLPEGPMRLGRELMRGLGGEATIIVRRGWEIGFARQARGIVIAGRQTSVDVEAPPNLGELARIEEQRSTDAMFPIMLSEEGLVLASGTAPTAPADMAAAIRAAETMIASRPQSAAARDNMRRYLAEIHSAGSGQFDTLPADLFFPDGTPQRRVETVNLPDGLTGTFELSWETRAAPGTGWLVEARRAIVTRIAELERRSVEVWTLAPI